MKKFFINITVLVSLGTLISRLLGFVREIVLAEIYGASIESDIILLTNSIPYLLYQGIGLGIIAAMIPLLNSLTSDSRKNSFISSLVTYAIVSTILFTIIGVFFSDALLNFFAPGFSEQEVAIASNLLIITLPVTIFSILTAIANGILQYDNKFYVVTFSQIPYNIITIAALWLGSIFGLEMVAAGTLVASIILFILQLPTVKKNGIRLRWSLYIGSDLKKFFAILIPISIVSTSQQFGSVVDRMLASTVGDGSIAALNFADRLYLLPFGIIIMAISMVYYPKIVRIMTEKNKNHVGLMNNIVTNIILLMLPISIYMYIFSYEIVETVFSRGSFNTENVSITTTIFKYFVVGLVALSLREVFVKVFFAMEDNRTALINSLFMVFINIILSALFILLIGLEGIALGTTISVFFSTFVLGIKLYKMKLLALQKPFFFKISLLGIFTFSVLYYTKFFALDELLIDKGLVTLIVSLLVLIPIYLMGLKLLKIKIIN